MTVALSPLFVGYQVLNHSGLPNAGGFIYVYQAGTSTPAITYTDSSGTIANTNPIQLDAAGYIPDQIWVDPGSSYKFVVESATGTILGTYDNIPGWSALNIGFSVSSTAPYGTVARALVDRGICVTDAPFNADPTGTNDSTAAFTDAGNSAPTVKVPKGTYLLNSSPSPTGTVTWLICAEVTFTGAGVGAATPLPGVCFFAGNSVISPIGNAQGTTCYQAVQAVSYQSAQREMAFAAGMRAVTGSGQSSPAADKVALFGGIDAYNGAYNVWGINTSTNITSGAATVNGGWGYELDINNANVNYGDAGSGSGLVAPNLWGLQITGASSYNATAAIDVSSTTGAKWNRGIVINGSSTIQSDIESYSSPARWAWLQGTYTHGLDTATATVSGYAIRLGNGQVVSAQNAAKTSDINMLQLNATNNLMIGAGSGINNVYLGTGASAPIYAGQSIFPNVDNAYQLGGSTNRWSVVYAATGTINTSDPSLKKDIASLPPCLGLLKELSPKTYKWKIGGSDEVFEEAEEVVQEIDVFEHEVDAVEMRDGKAVRVRKTVRSEVPKFVEHHVCDEKGNPLYHVVPEKSAWTDKQGVEHPAVPSFKVPVIHREPVMVTVKVRKKKYVEREGKRTHWGFLATDVRDVFAKTGMDFAGYVKGEDGTHHMRPDQLIPVLWKAVQELAAEVEALKAAQ